MRVQGLTFFLNALVAENRFIADGIVEIFQNLERIFHPGLVEKG